MVAVVVVVLVVVIVLLAAGDRMEYGPLECLRELLCGGDFKWGMSMSKSLLKRGFNAGKEMRLMPERCSVMVQRAGLVMA